MTKDVRSRIRSAQEAFEGERAADPPGDSYVSWEEVTMKDVRRLEAAIDRAADERDMQKYLERHPEMLIQHLGGGHGRWVIPQVRLGAQYVPDFVIGDRDSTGRRWTAVELESWRVTAPGTMGARSGFAFFLRDRETTTAVQGGWLTGAMR